ncbi:hypothetical protein A4A49_03098 [Nicotiana attenuata]|uniref:Uncharacterized protein n=1 Tax=Nicotiana attenuata TaxID=49451 RepID=A0A1J6IGK9_NICAT|nr:hypothetical protein A4A49_03098 [Nicotiana attenuata]
MPEASTRNGEMRREMDELREQVRMQGDALGEIRHMLVAMVTNNGAQKTQITAETAKNGEQHLQGNDPNYTGRYQRFNFPRFSGDDINGWLYKVEQFFDYEGIVEENKVQTTCINMEVAKRLGCKLQSIPSFVVSVADGSKVHSSVMTCGVTWNMQDVAFKPDMLVIPLGATNVVLRIQWVAADPDKVNVMLDWPIPRSLKELRGLLGVPKGSAIEPGQFQHVTRASGVQIGNDQDTTAAREIIGKPAVITPIAVALNSTVDRAISRSVKQAAAVDFVEKPSGIKASVGHVERQVLDTPRQSAIAPSKSNTKSNNWTVVNKSPSKKQSPGVQNQIVSSNVIGVSNSFDALVNEGDHATKEDENKEQQMDDETRSIAGKTSSTRSEKQQINAKDIYRCST